MQSIMEILTDKMTGLIESSASLAIHSKNSEIRNLHLLAKSSTRETASLWMVLQDASMTD